MESQCVVDEHEEKINDHWELSPLFKKNGCIFHMIKNGGMVFNTSFNYISGIFWWGAVVAMIVW